MYCSSKALRSLFSVVVLFFIAVSVSLGTDTVAGEEILNKKAGLGDTVQSFEKEWNKGYRKQFSIGINLGKDDKTIIRYNPEYAFGNPPRIGDMSGTTRIFNNAEFFKSIKEIIPSDTVCVSAWKKEGKETYFLYSKQLGSIPGIKDSWKYDRQTCLSLFGPEECPPIRLGTFILIVNYAPGSDHPEVFLVALHDHSKNEVDDMNPLKGKSFVKYIQNAPR